jgi:intracellular multiplication protein IcmE
MPQQPEQFDNTMAEAMQRQMQQLLDGWAPKGIKNVTVIKVEDVKAAEDKAAQTAATAAADNAAPAVEAKTIVSAGTVSYAQLLTEANSDVPGPILAQIVSGPLAGARAVGSFKVTTNYEKYLVLRFTIADKKGKDYKIDAIALDPDTTLGGMATEVDERYIARVLLPAAAGFLQGMGQALGQGNSTITTNGTTTIANQAGNGYKQGLYTGMGDAAQTMGQFFQNQANLTQPLVRVAAGTPMGLFFVAPVKEPTGADEEKQENKPLNVNGNGNNGFGYMNPGYPGTTVAGYGAGGYGAAAQNAANGAPYPNYAMPNGGYNYGNMPRSPGGGFGGVSPYAGYGQ